MIQKITYPCKIDSSMQPAMFYKARVKEPRPLLVALHTWSYDHSSAFEHYADYCIKHEWNMIFPEFRGPNWTPEGCGSDLVVSDLEDAVAYMKKVTNVDPNRIYLVGGSGGGHCSLLMAGRRPDLWTAVSSWCPISDIAAWHQECASRPCEVYSEHIEKACGGNPAEDPVVAMEAKKRSPLTWLPNAVGTTLVDISTGIHDGHTGSVPVSQAINAFNVLADEKDRISQEDIDYIVANEKIPESLIDPEMEADPAFGSNVIYFRRQSGSARLTLFEGGHTLLIGPATAWLSNQIRGKAADWSVNQPPEDTAGTELSK